MKTLVILLGVLGFSLSVSTATAQGGGTVTALTDGWYIQRFKEARITYLVDTVSRTCFISYAGGISSTSCKGLNRRPEWKAIISWE